MKLNLSKEILTGIKRAGNESLISEDIYSKILDEVSRYLENPLNPNSVRINKNTPRIDTIKECYACILALVIEVVRKNIEEDKIRDILKEQNYSEERINKIFAVLLRRRIPTSLALKRYGAGPPHILDVNWKMQYCVKSLFSDFDTKILYFIELIVKSQDLGTEKINFVCTVNQLQTFVASLKAAVRHLKSIAS